MGSLGRERKQIGAWKEKVALISKAALNVGNPGSSGVRLC